MTKTAKYYNYFSNSWQPVTGYQISILALHISYKELVGALHIECKLHLSLSIGNKAAL